MNSKTIHGLAGELRDALIEYIEATYHIGDTALAKQRRSLLEEIGTVHQAPFIESTPRYLPGNKFETIPGLTPAAVEVLTTLAVPKADGSRVLYDPPYTHQASALECVAGCRRSAVIMTGTGSGKTESFLMPILARLAREAAGGSGSFASHGMRAMILYPMNALVNDQLGRLRGILSDPRVVALFKKWASRPPRFARYTSRTPYAGIREPAKDQRVLKPFRDFYIDMLEAAAGRGERAEAADQLVTELKRRGKWPAKPDLRRWYGNENQPWQTPDKTEFLRAITLPDDSELLTRDESQKAAPDLLVTNYSMLEYMLMRPIEATIFDQTKEWLHRNPSETFLLVLDEAHLYRGSAGAEVGLLLRRLRDRLGIDADRFQVICATASFSDAKAAPEFASLLSGVSADKFDVIEGDRWYRSPAAVGTPDDADRLARLDMGAFYDEESAVRTKSIGPFLIHRGIQSSGQVERDLHAALDDYGPLNELINITMRQAQPADSLGALIFPGVPPQVADQAVTHLAALASAARREVGDASLLPCRVHTFFRGLRGLWVCMDPQCTAIDPSLRSTVGKLYSQPRELCECGARVLELYTCRLCGTPYARGYTPDPESPKVIWHEPGAALRTQGDEPLPLHPVDMLLVSTADPNVAQTSYYDVISGLVDPLEHNQGRTRTVHFPRPATAKTKRTARSEDPDDDSADGPPIPGRFVACGACGKSGQRSSPVQDHETKGDQPFQVLVSKQIQVQPPGPQPATDFAPLRGRKVLVFSDSRQVAARLAPNIQTLSARDSIRPLIAYGWKRLSSIPGLTLRLDDVYAAVLIAAARLGVRLRPELRTGEEFRDYEEDCERIRAGAWEDDEALRELCVERRSSERPEALMADMMIAIRDPSLGLEPLALASIVERADKRSIIFGLPAIPGLAETDAEKLQLARSWLRTWRHAGFWLPFMPERWTVNPDNRKVAVSTLKGGFTAFLKRLPPPAAKIFKDKWLDKLLTTFAKRVTTDYRLQGSSLSLEFDGPWVRCTTCTSVHRPVDRLGKCLDCGRGTVVTLVPETDELFLVRKGYYRRGVTSVLAPEPEPPMSIMAAEHTAQLNSTQFEDVFSKAELNELLFQDVHIPSLEESSQRTAIDVLSSTTTMEVGIDIGQLSGVALRNMPPGRANYQQRAGRAGRRGNAIASVVAFGGSDTHDEHYFSDPKAMIAGDVIDPSLSLDNVEIARRHVRAFLLQTYMQSRIAAGATTVANRNQLFSVLGTVEEFKSAEYVPSRDDLRHWLDREVESLRAQVDSWLPHQLPPEARQAILDQLAVDLLSAIDKATVTENMPAEPDSNENDGSNRPTGSILDLPVAPSESTAKQGAPGLLDALLFHGILPRYAFPTDVASFHIFNNAKSTRFRPVFDYTPSQGAALALSQYAPGKLVWVANKCYESGAIYTPNVRDGVNEWRKRKLYAECRVCGFTDFGKPLDRATLGHVQDCPTCRSKGTLGPTMTWFRPLGYAHPFDVQPVVSPEDIPETSYATRARLTINADDRPGWQPLNDRVRAIVLREHLLVSNSGPGRRGYAYCPSCGRIEAMTAVSLLTSRHAKPVPGQEHPWCSGKHITHGVVLGTQFITDEALFSFDLAPELCLPPADTVTHIAMRTLAEAMSRAATSLLEIEAGEILAEFRPANTPRGQQGLEAELFLYDTLPGGAGFASEAARKRLRLLEQAHAILTSCEGKCDSSCYRCLRTFRNRPDHALLDRHLGAALVGYLLDGTLPAFDDGRLRRTAGMLREDLQRQVSLGLNTRRLKDLTDHGGTRHVQPLLVCGDGAGSGVIVSVMNPLQQHVPVEIEHEGQTYELLGLSEILVRRHLAEAAQEVKRVIRRQSERAQRH